VLQIEAVDVAVCGHYAVRQPIAPPCAAATTLTLIASLGRKHPKLDRMFRSALDALDVLAKVKARGVSLHMIDLGGDVTGNGISKLVFTILSAVAEAERDRIRERVTQVKRDQRQRNRYLGGFVPFGFRVGDDGALVPDAAEQVLIAHARALRADGATLRAIQAVLEAQHGRKLSLDALHRMLADTARPSKGTPNHDVAGNGPIAKVAHAK
jgi:putative DNA-invertase from lambdoid prophage Rac